MSIDDPDVVDEVVETPGEGGAVGAVEPPPTSRKAAWLAMGAVALALALIWVAPGIEDDHFGEPTRADASLGDGGAPEDADFVGTEARLDFTLQDMHGVDVNLESFKGKVVVINFWATWCGPCRAEIPDLVELQDAYRGDLVVLGVSVDDTPEKLLPYAAEFKMNYPVLVGNGHQDFQDAYGPMWGIPVSVIIDRNGLIAVRHSGIATKEQFEQEIKTLL
jgi:thiol-disulfide isomerase/thioredoxin